MIDGLRIAMLLTDGFGGFGGISKFNCDFLEALNDSSQVESVIVLPRLIPNQIEGLLPEAAVYDRKAARGKFSFIRRVIAHSLKDPTDLVICGHINLLPMAWLMARLRGARLALIIHGIDAWKPPTSLTARMLARRVDSVISVSRVTATRFNSWSMVPIERFYILPNSVDLKRFHGAPKDPVLIERYGLDECKVLLTVGRLAPKERYKGFDEVIDALPRLVSRFPNLKYLIVGDGPDRNRLEKKARELSVEKHVVFAGKVSEGEKVAHYNVADLYVMPSSGEGFGIVLIEAAACGLPIVGSAVDGSAEALLHGQLGRLVDPKDLVGLVESIAAFLQKPAVRRRLEAVDIFSIEVFRAKVDRWLKQILHDQLADEDIDCARDEAAVGRQTGNRASEG